MSAHAHLSKSQLLALREQGLTNSQIAKRLGVATNTISYHLGPIKRRQPKQKTEELISEARNLERAGWFRYQVAERLGVSQNFLYRHLGPHPSANNQGSSAPARLTDVPPTQAITEAPAVTESPADIAAPAPALSRFKICQRRITLEGGMATYDLDFTSGAVVIDGIFAGTPIHAGELREIIMEMQDVLAMLESGQVEGGGGCD